MKRLIAFGILAAVMGGIGFLGYQIYDDVAEKRAVARRISTLPDLSAAALDGSTVTTPDLEDERPVVLVYFRTNCPFCQSEAKDIRAHTHLLSSAQIFMISREPRKTLANFAGEYELYNAENLQVLQDHNGEIAEFFDISTVPQTFIYDADRNLLKEFQGAASAENIFQAITLSSTGTPASSVTTGDCNTATLHADSSDCSDTP